MGKLSFGHRLQAIRQGRLIRQGPEIGVRELARASGVSATAISEAENGRQWVKKLPSYDDLRGLARALGVTIAQLVGEDDVPASPPLVDRETRELAEIGKEVLGMVERRNLYNVRPVPFAREGRRLPVVNAIAASQLWNEERQVEEMVVVPEMLLQGVTDPAAFVVVGDCLKDKGIVTGDYLIVDRTNKEPRDGEIVAASVNGEQTAKVFYRVGNTIELRPASTGYETIVVTPRDECEIIGVYVARFGKGG